MPEEYRVQESQNRFSVTIPSSLARAIGLEKGSKVKWKVEDSDTLKLEAK